MPRPLIQRRWGRGEGERRVQLCAAQIPHVRAELETLRSAAAKKAY